MFNGWISLRVQDPKGVSDWYKEHLGMEVLGRREDLGTQMLGSVDKGAALIFLPGEKSPDPERVQLHFHVDDVDAEYDRLKGEGVTFKAPPKDMPWRWRHAYTQDPAGHTVELCSPLPDAHFVE
ncbi:MAG TPA: VOC family protein [Pirellulales bacterium]|nr:VOC family protein [Pirellulales bacterium]